MNVRELLIRHEGLKLFPYKDTVGKITIGVGRNLDDVGISIGEANLLLDNDIAAATADCRRLPWFEALSEPRKAAVINLMFNLGASRFAMFVKFSAAMAAGNWTKAATELITSKWYQQVGRRGPEIVELIKNEAWPK